MDALLEQTAGIAAQVHDQRIDALGTQFLDQPAHVARGAAVVLLAGGAGIVVLIKTRYIDDADLRDLARR